MKQHAQIKMRYQTAPSSTGAGHAPTIAIIFACAPKRSPNAWPDILHNLGLKHVLVQSYRHVQNLGVYLYSPTYSEGICMSSRLVAFRAGSKQLHAEHGHLTHTHTHLDGRSGRAASLAQAGVGATLAALAPPPPRNGEDSSTLRPASGGAKHRSRFSFALVVSLIGKPTGPLSKYMAPTAPQRFPVPLLAPTIRRRRV